MRKRLNDKNISGRALLLSKTSFFTKCNLSEIIKCIVDTNCGKIDLSATEAVTEGIL